MKLTEHETPLNTMEQVPGYYKYRLGELVLTAVYDGYIHLPVERFKGIDAADIELLTQRMFQSIHSGTLQTAVNAYLVQTQDELILIDTGAAKCLGPTMGYIEDNISAAGYHSSDITTVLLTHMHPDHLCGLLTPEGKPAFPCATVRVCDAEQRFWLDEVIAQQAPDSIKPKFKLARDAVAAYQANGAFKTFSAGESINANIKAMVTPGHTIGHTSYVVQSGHDVVLVWGDLVHAHAIQFEHSEVFTEFDTDCQAAIKTRQSIIDLVATKRWLVAGAHLPFPGLGHVRNMGNGYAWVPVEYSPLSAGL